MIVCCDAGSQRERRFPLPPGHADVPAACFHVMLVVAIAVAVKVVVPLMPAAAAVTVLVPALGPNVRVLEARPLASVVTAGALILPPPAVTVKVIATPATGLP